MRLAGAALLALAGLLAGIAAAIRQRETVRRWETLGRMLALMELELNRFHTPLPELFDFLSEELEEPALGVCRRAALGLSLGGEFSALWCGCLGALTQRERELLLPLGRVLGRYGAGEQAAAAGDCRRAMEERAARLRAELRERSRIYVGVGAAAGVMLAVLLL